MSTSATPKSPLEPFSEPVRRWFEASFEAATPAQAAGWPAIASGEHTLICAPTGSGKTLASFLWGIDRLSREPDRLGSGVRIVYISPLKALSYDIERNLRAPLQGIGSPISVALRTGDTPQTERRRMRREPPDILITTPESLYLMISSGAREILGGVEAVIVDEIHAVAPSKRGSHLALTMERLDHLGEQPVQRIGLSATQRPLERIRDFLVRAGRGGEIVDASEPKQLALEIVVPVEDMVEPSPLSNKRRDGADTGKTPHQDSKLKHSPERIDPGPIEASLDPATNTRSIWPAIYPELLRLVREHSSTIVFVNNRRAAERIAKRLNEMHNDELEEGCRPPSMRATRRMGIRLPRRSLAPTTAPSPTRSGPWWRNCSSPASCPAWWRPHPWSWESTWAPSTWSSRSSPRSPSPGACSASVARATRSARS